MNAKDSLGWTPLIRAAVGGNVEGTKALLAAGADKNATDFFGRTALQVAEGRGNDEVIGRAPGRLTLTNPRRTQRRKEAKSQRRIFLL